MPAAAHFDPLPDRFVGRLWACRLAHGVRERLKIVGRWLRWFHGQPHNLPAERRGQPFGVQCAQIVAVWLDVGGQRPEHRGRVAVHVRECADGRLLAGGAGATTGTHLLTSFSRAHPPGERPAPLCFASGCCLRPCYPGPCCLSSNRTYRPRGGNAITSGTLHDRVFRVFRAGPIASPRRRAGPQPITSALCKTLAAALTRRDTVPLGGYPRIRRLPDGPDPPHGRGLRAPPAGTGMAAGCAARWRLRTCRCTERGLSILTISCLTL
jgi:hypothetical protein